MLQRLISGVYRTRPVRVRLPDGRELAGPAPGEPELTIVLRDLPTVARIAANPELALGEAYVDGGLAVEGGDIYAFLDLTAAELSGRPRRGPGPGLATPAPAGAVQRPAARASQRPPPL